jgi:hypothetical protein
LSNFFFKKSGFKWVFLLGFNLVQSLIPPSYCLSLCHMILKTATHANNNGTGIKSPGPTYKKHVKTTVTNVQLGLMNKRASETPNPLDHDPTICHINT